jgi:XTP/dITP diphosphohydrolase
MRQLLLATRNPGKLAEFQDLIRGLPVEMLVAEDVGLSAMDVEENGATLRDNALLKGEAYARASGHWTLADDTGLFVDALDGGPGVYTARFGGPAKLLDALNGISDRRAHFSCVIALFAPDGTLSGVADGRIDGNIVESMQGEGGFGYDPVFMPDGYEQTFAQMEHGLKNRISHRGVAIEAARPILEATLLA